jgi:tetratricopeptide (TPR) repeat protein
LNEAEKNYKEALKLKENMVLAHLNLGNVYFLKKENNLAEKEYIRSIELDSLSSVGYLALANLYEAEGKIGKAIDVYERMLVNVKNYPSGINYGMIISKIKNLEQRR